MGNSCTNQCCTVWCVEYVALDVNNLAHGCGGVQLKLFFMDIMEVVSGK